MRVLPPARSLLSFAIPCRPYHCASAWRADVDRESALACLHCHRHKGPNIAGSDPSPHAGKGAIVRLFHPRSDVWREHFEWVGATLEGRTAIGQATIRVLAINDPDFLAVREALIEERVFPFE
jgi:hypothetical protein